MGSRRGRASNCGRFPFDNELSRTRFPGPGMVIPGASVIVLDLTRLAFPNMLRESQ